MILFNFGTLNQKQGEMRWFMKVKDQKSEENFFSNMITKDKLT